MGLQSRKVAWGKRDGGYPVCIFEALVPLTCADCQRTIEVGERFTRGTRGFRTTLPICADCRQVEELPPGQQLSRVSRGRMLPSTHD
ncbi:MAG TPA: hypothetical protein VFI42_05165 [Thermomicrobiaceae bacterium]|nr:hypothetical protein [Thermomicrobiaceae bacterium]